jgi:hypothetical protein
VPENSLIFCYHCHRKWHSNPIESVEWFKNKFPERYKKIKKMSKKSRPITLQELEETLERLKKLDTPDSASPSHGD